MSDLERLAREAGIGITTDAIAKFYTLVRNEALEEAAKACDAQEAIYEQHIATRTGERLTRAENYHEAVKWLAAGFRAMKKEAP